MPDSARAGDSTLAVHAGARSAEPGAAVVTPIYQSATFFMDYAPGSAVSYTRYGTNPNHLAVAEKMCALEGAESAVVVASGNAACALALLACVRAGGHVLAQRELYGGTLRLLQRELPALGMEASLLPAGAAAGAEADAAWSTALRPDTRALLLEVPANPTLRIADLDAAVRVGSAHGLPVVVDATFASPINFRPLEHGADLVFHSATKYLGGHSDLSAGVVAGRRELVAEVLEKLVSFGPVLDPHGVWLLERGLRTLAVRMRQHNENGLAVARWLEGHAAVARVLYPGLPSHPDHARAARWFGGHGGVVALVLHGGDEAALRCARRLRLMAYAPSLGGVETLVSMPRYTSHQAVPLDEQRALGIDDGFLRLALGIEDARDLIGDLEQALAPELTRSPHAARP